MAKLHIDTNVFLDFYRSSSSSVKYLTEIDAHKHHLVLTEQTVNEFRRNRVGALMHLAGEIEKSVVNNGLYSASVLHCLPKYKELTELRKSYKELGKAICDDLRRLTVSVNDDPIANFFFRLAADPSVTVWKLDEQTISFAHRRKLLGNPPNSEDKHTIGDEVIWELLIRRMKDDLILLTRDGAFIKNESVLAEEYKERTGKELFVTDKLSKALENLGVAVAESLIEAEKADREARIREQKGVSRCYCSSNPNPSGWMPNGRFLVVRCLNCGCVLAAQEDPDFD
jgi:predicted nucleic acid-binding protein